MCAKGTLPKTWMPRAWGLEGVLYLGCHQHQDLANLSLPIADVLGDLAPQLAVAWLGIFTTLPRLFLLLLYRKENAALELASSFALKEPLCNQTLSGGAVLEAKY